MTEKPNTTIVNVNDVTTYGGPNAPYSPGDRITLTGGGDKGGAVLSVTVANPGPATYGPWVEHKDEHGEVDVRYRLGDNQLYVDFEFFDVTAWPPDVQIYGSVKWDGCMNWATNADCMAHFCGPEHAFAMAKRFEQVWHLAKSIMPEADFDGRLKP